MDSAFTLFAPSTWANWKRQALASACATGVDRHSLTEMSQGQVDIAFTVRENCINSDFRLDTLPNAICQRLLTIDDLTCLVQRDHPALQEPSGISPVTSPTPWQTLSCEGRDRWMLDLQAGGAGSLSPDRGDRALLRGGPAHGHALGHDSDPLPPLRPPRHPGLPLVPLPLPIALDSISHLLIWHQRHGRIRAIAGCREKPCFALIMGKLETSADGPAAAA